MPRTSIFDCHARPTLTWKIFAIGTVLAAMGLAGKLDHDDARKWECANAAEPGQVGDWDPETDTCKFEPIPNIKEK